MQSAAGGTNQRLKPAFAIVCSRSRIPDPALGTLPALLIEVIQPSPGQQPIAGHVCCSATLITRNFTIVLSLLFVLCTIHRAPLSHGASSGRIGAESHPRVDRQKVDMAALADSCPPRARYDQPSGPLRGPSRAAALTSSVKLFGFFDQKYDLLMLSFQVSLPLAASTSV